MFAFLQTYGDFNLFLNKSQEENGQKSTFFGYPELVEVRYEIV
jgi:hypothetical protein